MLAIMNIGKYSSSGIVPSGSDLFTIKANQSLGQAIDFYAKHGNVVLGLPYMQNVIYRSVDGGATWSTVSSPYYLAHIFYSSITEKFYALELGDEIVPQTLHYGESTDGETWTWETLLTNSTTKMHYYGTFIEEVNGTVAFDVFKLDATSVAQLSGTAIASHIRIYTDESEEQIGTTYQVKASTSGSSAISDVYPSFTSKHGKIATGLVFENWTWVGTTYTQTRNIVVGAWGVDEETSIFAQTFSQGEKCFDKFYYSRQTGNSSTNAYYAEYYNSFSARFGTWTRLVTPTRPMASTFDKVYGFFQLGSYYYMAYKVGNVTKWYRAGDIETLIEVAITDVFNKADMTGVPVSEFSIDNKHFLLSMSNGNVYLCEAT